MAAKKKAAKKASARERVVRGPTHKEAAANLREAREKAKQAAAEARAKAAADKAAAAEKAAAEKAKLAEAANKKLDPLAAAINARFEKAAQAEGKADDHRLAAALELEQARQRCTEAGIAFKEWCEKHVKQSYHTVRKLVAVATAPEPRKALEDLREANKEANKKHRDAQKKKKLTGPGRSASPEGAAIAAFEAMPEASRVNLIKSRAESEGMAVVSQDEAKMIREVKRTGVSGSVVALQEAFNELKASEKMEFLEWAGRECGVKVESPTFNGGSTEEAPAEDLLGPFARRPRKRA